MQKTDSPIQSNVPDDSLTVASIAVLAFVVADIAHEGLGHGFGFYFAGGHSSMLTTTRLIEWVKLPDPQWRIFDLGGPAGNLLFALVGWLGQRLLPRRTVHLRFFLWLVMAFSLFWAFGYLIFCAVIGRGDWMALIEGTKYLLVGRVLFAVIGFALYRASIRIVAGELRWIVPLNDSATKQRITRLIWISYISGGLIACAGAALDPGGALEIFRSGALSSFGAAVGLLFAAGRFSQMREKQSLSGVPVSRDLPWIIAAAAASIYFIWILGPGILLYFGD